MPNPNKNFTICTNKRGEFLNYEVTDLRYSPFPYPNIAAIL
jgi:hypothetical protein